MEELGLGCFLQLVEEPPQSHQVQFVRSIFEEPGGKKLIFYLGTIPPSLCGRMMMVILLTVSNENV